MNNPSVTSQRMIAAARPSCLERCKAEGTVLLTSDSSDVSLNERTTGDLGSIGKKGSRGLVIHATYAVTPDEFPLGVLGVEHFVRPPDVVAKNSSGRGAVPVCERESRKWFHTLDVAGKLREELGHEPRIICVMDREGDIAPLLCRADQERATYSLLVRGKNNRTCNDDVGGPRVWDRLLAQPAMVSYDIDVPSGPKRKGRIAHMDVRFIETTLAPVRQRVPVGEPEQTPPCRISVVMATERDAPPGVAALDWRLYTTLEVRTIDDAIDCVKNYAARWAIEVLFRTWKSTMRAEQKQYRDGAALQCSLTMDLLLAFTFLQIAHLHRVNPHAKATEVFDMRECQALWRYRYGRKCARAPTLAEMSAEVAALGGHSAKSKAGARTFARGMQKLAVIVEVVGAICR
jgi:hypothetical protein